MFLSTAIRRSIKHVNNKTISAAQATRRRAMTTNGYSGIQRVTIVGSGTLGTQVALQTAITGHDVKVLDVSQDALDMCQQNHQAILKTYVARDDPNSVDPQARAWKGLSSEANKSADEVATETLERLTYTTDTELALTECDLVSENVPEVPDIKASTYANLGKYAPPHTIFTTNSSTLLPSDFVKDVDRPKQFLALHFANGIWDANIGEVMPHPGTDPEITKKVVEFAKDIRMVPFNIQKEQNGYLINTMLVPWLNAAQTLITNGVAESPADVDRAWLISVGAYRAEKPGSIWAPFMTMDKIGIPLVSNVFNHWGEILNDEQMKANGRYLKEHYVDTGKHGITNSCICTTKASGKYSYPNPEYTKDDFL